MGSPFTTIQLLTVGCDSVSLIRIFVLNMKQMELTKSEKQKQYRLMNGNACTKKYEKTKRGFLVRMYRNMKSRTCGIQYLKSHLYLGLDLLDKQDFYQWANASAEFHEMFAAWETSGHCRKLTPTVDRIDSSKGYEVGNMQWLTHSDNSKKGNRSRIAMRSQNMNTTK
jgi:hypothetical protein